MPFPFASSALFAGCLARTACRSRRVGRRVMRRWRPHLHAWLGEPLGGTPVTGRHPTAFRPAAAGSWCPRCGRLVGSQEPRESREPPGTSRPCGPGCRRLGDAVVVLGADEPPLATWVRAVKRGGGDPELGTWLGRRLGHRIAAGGLIPSAGHPIVVPMPVAGPRRAGRGIDHAGVIAAGVAAACGGIVRRGVLEHGGGGSQALRGRHERLQAASGAIRAGRRWLPAGSLVILVDDVRTTGATLQAAVVRLRDRGAGRIVVAVLSTRDRREAPEATGGGGRS